MKKTPRSANYETPFDIVNGCVVQRLPKWEIDNLWPYRWEVIAPQGHRIAGYMTTSLRRVTKKEAMLVARYDIEPGEPG